MGEEKKKGALMSFIGGIVLTLVLVIAVPVIVSWFVEPIVIDLIGDTTVASLSSSAIAALVMFLVMIAFMWLLGAGAIVRKYGIIGILGLIVAYWWMGDITQAIFPIIIVILMGGLSWLLDKRKNKK